MELGIHLPLMEFGDEGLSLARLTRAVDAARECGLAAVSANDHFLFGTPWLDGPSALAAVVERSGSMELATTVALVSLRGPVQLAKTIAALDVLSEGRVIAGVGPGSSERDYDAVGVPFDERWALFEDSVKRLRELLGPESPLFPAPLRPGGVPLWLASWGSKAGMRRVARLGDGWFASAYNTSPEAFAIRTRCATSCASAHRSNARSCCRATRKRDASGSTSGRWAMSRARSSSPPT